jgi:2-succinyl-6-hydroxy-2,4-cyclohexadiene-1-carboxylate synthase
MGARLGLAAVLAHPERVRGAVLIGVDPGLVDPSARAERIAIEEGWARTLEQGGLAGFVERWAELPIFATQTPALVEAQRGRRLAHDATAIARQVRRLGLGRMPEQWEGLSRCSVPLVVMAGDKDAKFVGLGRRIVEACPRARLELIEGAGHNLALEAPERVAAVIRDL